MRKGKYAVSRPMMGSKNLYYVIVLLSFDWDLASCKKLRLWLLMSFTQRCAYVLVALLHRSHGATVDPGSKGTDVTRGVVKAWVHSLLSGCSVLLL
jgi:hypothetical protein